MFRKKIKNFLIIFLLSLVFFWLGSQALAQEEPIFTFSLNFQKVIRNFWQNIFSSSDEDIYKEKYYDLLRELAKLKLSLKEVKETGIIDKSKFYNLQEANILKIDQFGYIYAENIQAKEGMLVLDKNFALVGKVSKVTKNYLIISSLNVSGIEFNIANLDGEFLGLGKTISNGFLEVNYVKPETQVKLNDFILTYGDDSFPSGFLVGSVRKINKTQFGQQIIVKLLFNLDSGKIYLIK